MHNWKLDKWKAFLTSKMGSDTVMWTESRGDDESIDGRVTGSAADSHRRQMSLIVRIA